MIQYKIFESAVKGFDDASLTVDHFISTEHQDRGGDIMRAKGMKVIGKPVVLMLHGRGPMGSEPVAKPISITMDTFKGQPGILAKTQFYDDEVGRRLYGKVKGGFLPNWSIGYSVLEAKDILSQGQYSGREVTKWELLEYSPVGVPMNPFAQTVKEFLDKVDETGVRPANHEERQSWFGIVDEKSCTGCGLCKADEELEEVCATCGKKLWKEWTKTLPHEALRVYCKDGCEVVSKEADPPSPKCAVCSDTKIVGRVIVDGKPIETECPSCKAIDDPMKAINEKFTALEIVVSLNAKEMKNLKDACDALSVGFAKLEPLLKTLPPEPEGGDKGKEGDGHPPDPPARLVFRDVAAEQRRKAEEDRKLVIENIRSLLVPGYQKQVDQILGKVN